jgi:hypothetical protein
MLDDLTPEAIEAIVALAGPDAASPLIALELRQLGGALGRVPEDAGARRRLPGKILTLGIGVPMYPGHAAAIEAHVTAIEAALRPFENGQRYLNFVEHDEDMATMYEDGDLARLAAVRGAYDAEGLLQANHEIAPAVMRKAA